MIKQLLQEASGALRAPRLPARYEKGAASRRPEDIDACWGRGRDAGARALRAGSQSLPDGGHVAELHVKLLASRRTAQM